MQPIEMLPDFHLEDKGPISCCFIERGIQTFHEACHMVQSLPYDDNALESDDAIFMDGCGTCISKHRAIAVCAREQGYPVFQVFGIYELDGSIVEGVNKILDPYGLSFVPAGHCFLACRQVCVDLTDGNRNGKKCTIEFFLATARIIEDGVVIKDRLYEMCVDNLLDFDPRFRHISRAQLNEAKNACIDQMHRQR